MTCPLSSYFLHLRRLERSLRASSAGRRSGTTEWAEAGTPEQLATRSEEQLQGKRPVAGRKRRPEEEPRWDWAPRGVVRVAWPEVGWKRPEVEMTLPVPERRATKAAALRRCLCRCGWRGP